MNSQPLDTFYTTPYGDFAIKQTRFGLYVSYDRDETNLVTGLTWEACWTMTPSHLCWAQEGYTGEQSVYSGEVTGKL